MTTSSVAPVSASDWTAITAFRFRFADHAHSPGINGRSDNAYSYEITDPDELFVDDVLRTSLHTSVISLVRTKIAESTKTEATSTADKSKTLQLFNMLLLSTRDTSVLPFQIRTASNFGASLDNTFLTKNTLIVFIDPSSLRFATNPLDICNFDDMRLDQDFPYRYPNGTLKAAAPAPAPSFAPPGGVTLPTSTIHAGITTLFNLHVLPPDVIQRLSDHADKDMILSKSDSSQFTKVTSRPDPNNTSEIFRSISSVILMTVFGSSPAMEPSLT